MVNVYVSFNGLKCKYRCKTDVRYEGAGVVTPELKAHPYWRRYVADDLNTYYRSIGLPNANVVVLEVVWGIQKTEQAVG